MTTAIDYGTCECECGECAFGRHCHHGGYCQVGHEGPCTCSQCVSPFLAKLRPGPHPAPARSEPRPKAAPVPGWSLRAQAARAGKAAKYRVVGPWRASLVEVERDMKLVCRR